MSEVSQVQTDARLCPVCPDESGHETWVEPEQDGDHIYYECPECMYAFGWQRIDVGVSLDGSCQLGIPEGVRRASSAPMEKSLAREQAAQPVQLTIGRRPE